MAAFRPDQLFELELMTAVPGATATRVRVDLEEADGVTTVRLSHTGWGDASDHSRVSSYCWAIHQRHRRHRRHRRHLRRHEELGVVVPYDQRLEEEQHAGIPVRQLVAAAWHAWWGTRTFQMCTVLMHCLSAGATWIKAALTALCDTSGASDAPCTCQRGIAATAT